MLDSILKFFLIDHYITTYVIGWVFSGWIFNIGYLIITTGELYFKDFVNTRDNDDTPGLKTFIFFGPLCYAGCTLYGLFKGIEKIINKVEESKFLEKPIYLTAEKRTKYILYNDANHKVEENPDFRESRKKARARINKHIRNGTTPTVEEILEQHTGRINGNN